MADFQVDFNFNDPSQKPRAGGATPGRPDAGGVGVGVSAQDQNFVGLLRQGAGQFEGMPELLNVLSIMSDTSTLARKVFLTARKVFQIFVNMNNQGNPVAQLANRTLRFGQQNNLGSQVAQRQSLVQKRQQQAQRILNPPSGVFAKTLTFVQRNFATIATVVGTVSIGLSVISSVVQASIGVWRAANRAVDGFINKVQEFSPQIQQAQAQREIAETMAAIRANQTGGSAAAAIIESRTGVATALTQLSASFTKAAAPFIKIGNQILEAGIEGLTAVIDLITPIAEVLGRMFNWMGDVGGQVVEYLTQGNETIDQMLFLNEDQRRELSTIRKIEEDRDTDFGSRAQQINPALSVLTGGALAYSGPTGGRTFGTLVPTTRPRRRRP